MKTAHHNFNFKLFQISFEGPLKQTTSDDDYSEDEDKLSSSDLEKLGENITEVIE
jgi:hypothetical protein